MELSIKYGHEQQEISIPDTMIIDVLKPKKLDKKPNEIQEVKSSLKNPIGTKKLNEIVNEGENIVIITSDITRPTPSYKIIPIIIDELNEAGINNKDITIVFALGNHRNHTKEEMKKLIGRSIYNKIKCVDSNLNECIRMGKTKLGTPVDIFKIVAEADRRICIGNIEYHYFAGYSGGAKAIMPGVSTKKAIQLNHSKMVSLFATAGELEFNPVRMDIEDAINYCSIDFIVNVVLDENKNIIKSVAGDYILAHREGCKFLDKIYKVNIDEKADIVIVSQGGYPKDLNLYQTQKALDNAKNAVKEDGIIILIGACNEGIGEKVFEDWMINATNPEEIIERIQVDFKLGGHKAAAIALILKSSRIFLVSKIDDYLVKNIFMEPFKNAQEALNKALKIKGENAKVIVIPFGGSTLPYFKKNYKY